MTYTKQHAADNRAMIKRAKELLADIDIGPDTVANQHPEIAVKIKKEFPHVDNDRIRHRVAQAIRQLRYEKYNDTKLTRQWLER